MKEEVVSTQTGFMNRAAIERTACPAGKGNQTVDWDAYDESYSAAGRAFTCLELCNRPRFQPKL